MVFINFNCCFVFHTAWQIFPCLYRGYFIDSINRISYTFTALQTEKLAMEIASNLFSITGKTALVTGCSRGIGRAMAVGLAEAGADIIGLSNSLQPGSDTEKAVLATCKKFYPYAADLGDREALYNFIKKVKEDHPRIDILVNNAGTILRAPAAEHSDEYWDKVMSINLDAQFILTREIGRRMIEQGKGKIVFTCSLL